MRLAAECSCGATQKTQPKMMVFKTQKKTNVHSDEFDHRFPSRIIINKRDIAYITTKRADLVRGFVAVIMDDGTEYFSDHPLKNFVEFMPDALQINRATVIPCDKILATNEWLYVYAGSEEEPFEISDNFRDEVKRAVTMVCTLPKKHEKRLP